MSDAEAAEVDEAGQGSVNKNSALASKRQSW
jgi:hypothetical protein